ncbi:MAG: hypothetical protein M1831_004699 [Alyxoria varia]|nr:MAG: hypothetical protein M1831_004699 [Alyxoria varia]
MAPGRKRKASSSPAPPPPASKKPATSHAKCADVTEQHGIVNRDFYPKEISNERCKEYNQNSIMRPIEELERALKDTAGDRESIDVGKAVIFWFKRDLRLRDNKPLSEASDKAQSKGVPLICVYTICPQDYEAHLRSASHVDFLMRSLAILKEDLERLNIPLLCPMVHRRKNLPEELMDLAQEYEANHIYCGIEYEVDELRREAKLVQACLGKGISFSAIHDTCIVAPGQLKSGQLRQYEVYSPWYRAWMAHIHLHPHLLNEFPEPAPNDPSTEDYRRLVFSKDLPSAPDNKRLTKEEKQRFASLYPAGEHEAYGRLRKFIDEGRIKNYKEARNLPAGNSTSMLSVHFSSGTLSARTAVREALAKNSSKKLDTGNAGIVSWISEVAWRDFYKHVLAHWPFVCMNKGFKYEFTELNWEYNMEHFDRWCKGQTGFPIVDAAMRQSLSTGYIHNRCRMIVASFLTKDLLLDWRLGEQHFMLVLIDGDFASNSGGWGFSASVGVDPQPYFRIFNPVLQSEKFDKEGEYIKKWVPELREVTGKAVHDPYGRGAAEVVQKKGYPRMIVDHAQRRAEAMRRFKEVGRPGLDKSEAAAS